MRTIPLALALMTLSGCRAETSVQPDPTASKPTLNASALVGEWSQLYTIRGASFVFTLTAHDSTVSGTGSYAIEAGRSGTITVHGVAGANRTSLDFVYDYGTEAHFEGPPAERGLLDGAMKYGPRDALIPQFAVMLVKRR